eukprot:1487468-Prymnesium_polylepis.2
MSGRTAAHIYCTRVAQAASTAQQSFWRRRCFRSLRGTWNAFSWGEREALEPRPAPASASSSRRL